MELTTRLRTAVALVLAGTATGHVAAQSLCGGADPNCGPNSVQQTQEPAQLPVTPFNSPDVVWGELAGQANEMLTIPQAVPPAGCMNPQLVRAEVSVTLTVQGNLEFENRNNNAIPGANVNFDGTIRLVSPIIPGGTSDSNFSVGFAVPGLPAYDGVLDFGGTSGLTRAEGPIDLPNPPICFSTTNPATLAMFLAGPVQIQHSATSISTIDGVGDLVGGTDFSALLQARVRYVYCCTVGGGDCPDCIRDPRSPASLLIYPEFCNDFGRDTLVTVTNANCFGCTNTDLPPEVFVEFIFINGDTCDKQDFTVPLTPCDTFTFLTRTQTAFRRGYIYAFAKNAAGQAIKFDHLTGQEIIVDGFRNLDWSINATGFAAGRDLAEGAPTDADFDNVRDLNNVEYIAAPERIIIPRFLGQDPFPNFFASYRSTLTFINLSGGRAFTTIVDLSIWNDSEECFSDQHEFYCWDKQFLADISPAFTENFLDATNDDPLEIVGWNDKEAGWVFIDGRTANSGVELIVDPAIYAVLVEERSGRRVADLPWEEGCQDNGDLLPVGIFGDPTLGNPGGVNGDNQ